MRLMHLAVLAVGARAAFAASARLEKAGRQLSNSRWCAHQPDCFTRMYHSTSRRTWRSV
jgi:hypothetical protein